MIIFLLIMLYIIVYLLYFQVKAMRDYIMEYERGYTHRWDNSIWAKKFPIWVQAYLLGEEKLFAETAPRIIKLIFYSEKEKNFRVGVDGWHQLDGLIFILPHALFVITIGLAVSLPWFWILFWALVVPFLVWYAYFNVVFHILHMKTNKQWFRVKWLAKLLGKKTER